MNGVTYIGTRDGNGTIEVRKQIDELPAVPLDPRLDLRNHSPTGFEIAYGGSGPAQLAIALLADVMGDEFAEAHYQAYKQRIIAALPFEGFKITAKEVEAWAAEIQQREGQ
jgi:Family of unknown function (DUF6166)